MCAPKRDRNNNRHKLPYFCDAKTKFKACDYPKAVLLICRLIANGSDLTEESTIKYDQLLTSICDTNWNDFNSLLDEEKESGFGDLEDIQTPEFEELKEYLKELNAPFIVYNNPKRYEINVNNEYENIDQQPNYWDDYRVHIDQMRQYRLSSNTLTQMDKEYLQQNGEQCDTINNNNNIIGVGNVTIGNIGNTIGGLLQNQIEKGLEDYNENTANFEDSKPVAVLMFPIFVSKIVNDKCESKQK